MSAFAVAGNLGDVTVGKGDVLPTVAGADAEGNIVEGKVRFFKRRAHYFPGGLLGAWPYLDNRGGEDCMIFQYYSFGAQRADVTTGKNHW